MGQVMRTENHKGFTLIEQVVAMLILALITGAVLVAIMTARSSQEAVKQRIQALNLARQGLEALMDRQTTAYANIARGTAGTTPPYLINTESGITLDPGASVTATRTTLVQPIPNATNEQYLKATVNVQWQLNKIGSPITSNETIEMFISR